MLSEPLIVPDYPLSPPSDPLPAPDDEARFEKYGPAGESSSATQPLLDPEVIVSALASSGAVQRATRRDAGALVRWMGARWSVETALAGSEF